MSTRAAITAKSLGKLYRIGGARETYQTLRETLVDAVGAPYRRMKAVLKGEAASERKDTIWALRDVSFEVEESEAVGIIGRNGAGKSTLLKVLSRVTPPTEGRADIRGRLGALLEVGTGFHPELTGRENVFLNASILGMQKKEIERRFDEIVAFAEVERFLETPVKHYSSGMYVRLAFAIAAHVEPEILVVDEVLAVGDAAFQKKCLGKLTSVAGEGRTVLFVSHSMAAIHRLCSRAIWIDDGRVRADGIASDVVAQYLKETTEAVALGPVTFPDKEWQDFQLVAAHAVGHDGKPQRTFECDEPVVIDCVCRVKQRIPGVYGYLEVRDAGGIVALVSDSMDALPNELDGLPPGRHQLRVVLPPRTLAPGSYTVYMNFTASSGETVDAPGVVCAFDLEDRTSMRGNHRAGYHSVLLRWTVEPEAGDGG